MADWRPLLWAKQSAQDRSPHTTCENLLNCFYEANPEGSENPWKIIGRPGHKFFGAYGSGPVRGALFSPEMGKLFVVSATTLYVVSSDASSVILGAILGTGPVEMCANASQVLICSSAGSYWATAVALTQLDTNHYSSCAYQDGYGICVLAGTNQFYITGIDDFSTINPLAFTSADSYTGTALAVRSCNRQAVVFGSNFLTPYYNSGNASFPFSQSGGGVIQIGTKSAQSVTLLQDAIAWLADDLSVQIWAGGQHQPISTPGVEAWIGKRQSPETARGFRYRQEGHDFLVLNFIDGSIGYNRSTGKWHSLGSWSQLRYRADCLAVAWGKYLVGDYANGNIYSLDSSTYEDGDAGGVTYPLIRTITPPPVSAGGGRGIMHAVKLNSLAGVGLDGYVDGYDPQWGLDYSDDDGRTWSNQLFRSAGKIGQYKTEASWARLGQFRHRTMRFSLADPVNMAVDGAYYQAEACYG